MDYGKFVRAYHDRQAEETTRLIGAND